MPGGRSPEHALEFILAFDGRVHWLEEGYRIKFEIRRVTPTRARPHGLQYSFTLHDPRGVRLVGFDNAHHVDAAGSRFKRRPAAADHWHRSRDDGGRPYTFVSADQLVADFFAEVGRVLAMRGLSDKVARVEERKEP